MKSKSLLLILPFLLLTSCNYGYAVKTVSYENHFFLWPSGVNYSSIINCRLSYYDCTYDNSYEYYLLFNDGDEIKYSGEYVYEDEKFYLYDNNECILMLEQINYYQFVERITYEGQQYNLIWHAQHIFD